MFWKTRLSSKRMCQLEEWLAASELSKHNDCSDEELSEAFHLKVEYADEGELPKDTEAVLMPCEDENYVGLIKLQEKFRATRFAYIHEIIHYLMDVGQGNHVTKTFTRKTTGKTENDHEQNVNYITAAYIMPLSEMKEELKRYDESVPKIDELQFVQGLKDKYGQSRDVVIRRVQEVRKISSRLE
ncbi:MAG: ImmA/IrrE family metallo-endopeptidase [Lachnospiraceae bacterium]|nr:ImmA/IrrE family metallo-endopeptidase [Lachnospiraceae bacterium]